jgi:hypothetical protein
LQGEVAGRQRPPEGGLRLDFQGFSGHELGYGAAFCRKRGLSGIFCGAPRRPKIRGKTQGRSGWLERFSDQNGPGTRQEDLR